MQDMQNDYFVKTPNACWVTSISLVLGLLFNYFFFGKIPGISFLLYVSFVLTGLFILSKILKKQPNREVFLLSVLLIFFSIMVAVRSSSILVLLDIALSLALLLLISEVFFCRKLADFLIKDYINIFCLPFKFFQPSFKTLSNMLLSRDIRENQKTFSQIAKGISMSIPVLFIFLLLFSSSDLIFQKYVSKILSIDNELEVFLRFLIILFVMVLFTGAYVYSFRSDGKRNIKLQNSRNNMIGQLECNILLASVNILFFFFIFLQLTHLFGGERNVIFQGFTYSEYARRGFFELIIVAVITLPLLFITEQYVIKKETGHTILFRIFGTILIGQTLLIMFSAFTRLALYEEAYGFTVLRLYSQLFIIFLSLIYFLLYYKINRNKEEKDFAHHVFMVIVCFAIVINILNPDLFIAKRNIARFEESGKIDLDYLNSLSDDAIPAMIELLDSLDGDLENILASELYWRSQNLNSQYFSQWPSINFSRIKAGKILTGKMDELESHKNDGK